LDDGALIRLIVRGQPEALSALYDRYHRLVFSLALNAVGDGPTAEEITLDVFTHVWQKAATYHPERARVSTWLTSIARHRSIDVLRHRRARAEQHNVGWADLAADSDEVPRVTGPEPAAELAIRRQRVRAAIAQLPEEQRQVLALAYFRGYTHMEIAETLGQPLGTVKTRIRLAMDRLRNLLQDESTEA